MADKNYYLNLVQRLARIGAGRTITDRVAYTSMNLHSYLHSKIRGRKIEVKQEDAVEDEWEYQRENGR
jgi:hypothetical protein